ncbi:hypothetical protein [Marinobacterium rhizophilum]|uniref:hypothetical protein n=1 Tax=Marinobacterium rhizophilum TaxID=420402 RepID=UPI0012EB238A|nr:hypothetical protein [Marinobacterium rhizophilum]
MKKLTRLAASALIGLLPFAGPGRGLKPAFRPLLAAEFRRAAFETWGKSLEDAFDG